jgi:hypothetical protein
MASSSAPAPRSPWWAPLVALVAVVATVVLGALVRLVLGHQRSATDGRDGGAYAPEPLTGDPSSVGATDVAPV